MTTATDIANRALGRLGETAIMDFDEASTAARAVRLHYEPTRDSLLRSHPWNFAVKRVTLSRVLPVPIFTWSYKYQLPADSLRLLEVNGSDISVLGNYWAIEGQLLLSNDATMEIVYVAASNDCAVWDALFQDAMVIKLAMRLAETIRGGSGIEEKLAAELERMVGPLARRVDSNENRPRENMLPTNSRFVQARGFGYVYNPEISGYGW